MAIYINKKTKATLVTDDVISGDDWELFDPKKNEKVPTVPELQSLLTEIGVEFNPKANKAELLALYEEHKGS